MKKKVWLEIKIFKKKEQRKKRVRKCESKDENTNWNSSKGSVKKNDKLFKKRKKKDFGSILE
jgi:hypothetical protein